MPSTAGRTLRLDTIEYSQERGKPPVSASIVRVHEEGPSL